MRTSAAILLALLALTAATAASAAPASAKPRLRFADGGIVGSGFKAHERVRVKVAVGSNSQVKRVRASTGGRFTVRFQLAFSGCEGGYFVTARGSRGSRASLTLHGGCPEASSAAGPALGGS